MRLVSPSRFAFFVPLRPYLHYRSRLYHIVAHSSYLLAHHIPNSSEGIYRTVDYSSHLFRYRLWCCCVVFDHIATASVSFWSPPRGDCLQSPSGLPLTIPTKFSSFSRHHTPCATIVRQLVISPGTQHLAITSDHLRILLYFFRIPSAHLPAALDTFPIPIFTP